MTITTAAEARKKRDLYLQRTYGLGLVDYDQLLAAQGGGCAVCRKTPEEEGKALAVDHDHSTNQVRGLLCTYCNHRLVGRHRRDLGSHTKLRAVADYLDRDYYPFFAPAKKKKRRRRVGTNRKA